MYYGSPEFKPRIEPKAENPQYPKRVEKIPDLKARVQAFELNSLQRHTHFGVHEPDWVVETLSYCHSNKGFPSVKFLCCAKRKVLTTSKKRRTANAG